jgi:hypothetical protein
MEMGAVSVATRLPKHIAHLVLELFVDLSGESERREGGEPNR